MILVTFWIKRRRITILRLLLVRNPNAGIRWGMFQLICFLSAIVGRTDRMIVWRCYLLCLPLMFSGNNMIGPDTENCKGRILVCGRNTSGKHTAILPNELHSIRYHGDNSWSRNRRLCILQQFPNPDSTDRWSG